MGMPDLGIISKDDVCFFIRQISRAAYLASAHLAREKGVFPLFDRSANRRRAVAASDDGSATVGANTAAATVSTAVSLQARLLMTPSSRLLFISADL